MISGFRAWLNNLPYTDLLQRRQAGLLQSLLLTIALGSMAGFGLRAMTLRDPVGLIVAFVVQGSLCVSALIALWQLRRGAFRMSAYIIVSGVLLALGITMLLIGVQLAETLLPALMLPIALTGLVLGRRTLWAVCIIVVSMVALTMIGATFWPDRIGSIVTGGQTPAAMALSFTLMAVILSVFLDRFGGAVQAALAQARIHEEQLEALRASLEEKVAERTASLQQTIDELSASQQTIRALNAPAIPVLPGVLALPLVGSFDTRRVMEMREILLAAVVKQRAHVVIFDVTGVQLIDTQVAQALLETAAAVRLLGADAYLAGIRAEVAQTLVALEVDLNSFRAFASLQDAIGALIA